MRAGIKGPKEGLLKYHLKLCKFLTAIFVYNEYFSHSTCHVTFLSLIFLLKCLPKSTIITFFLVSFKNFRAHLNDLENIPIFFIVMTLYLLTNMPAVRAIWCMRIFTIARIIHTISYLNAISKPRGISFLIGAGCTVFLAGNVLYSAVKTGVF